jgi:hypothetical protein
MIYIPIARSLNTAQNIRNSNPSKKQIKRARDASSVGRLHFKNTFTPLIGTGRTVAFLAQPWRSVLPMGINIPILPYI